MKEERNEDQAARCFTGGPAVVAACLSSCSPTGLQTPGCQGLQKESDCALSLCRIWKLWKIRSGRMKTTQRPGYAATG